VVIGPETFAKHIERANLCRSMSLSDVQRSQQASKLC
jgi:hypothetical protein